MTATEAAAGVRRTGRSGGQGSGGQQATELLEHARATVHPELRAAVESLPEAVARVARHHFGWEPADGVPAGRTPGDTHGPGGRSTGKAIRPALVLTAARALGGEPAQALRAAVAVELVHNFTLLHDDVIDGDRTRRHRPTAWTVFGVPDAIVTGDALQALALRLLAEDPHPAAPAAAARLATCIVELCAGQQADCAFEKRRDVAPAECLAMARAKTGALLGCACALGGLYAGATREEVEALDSFGREAGLAFQLIDDLIGIWGDPAHTGKPSGADLAARKKSLPVVAALATGTEAAAELAAVYAGEGVLDEDAVRRAADAVERAGGRDWAQAQAAQLMSRAVGHLARVVPEPADADGLLALAEFVTRRTR
ncbi:family 2 encapsulin nanocompartment cargo protein polyprenyl transferase [Streptomyces sp. GC420]|uniref:family 2 encapsulin nanocompartment cargo protein polyprenyl transferase n=1 Tax=Streptomyces sp. GC420 TaxID=2697568 RepID=UPI001414E702|nr:family 2 encapsulin nanocompartment cargo protein polyprenyl transferase [Streptomyces sp. GC420]NBM15623.1 polyprenyl synthetase family protein [Streptomyces sp. GC420]